MNGYQPFPEMDESYVPEGIAGIDFPISLYDRPTLAFSNLLMRGDIDAATRAILSPQTLTPTELQTFRSRLLKGKKPSPILKTILDVTTNPLFVIGLALSFLYPIAGVKPLHALYTGAVKEVAKVGAWSSMTHSAFTNLRNIPGFIKVLVDFTTETVRFQATFGRKMAKVFKGLNVTDEVMRDAFMLREKWHTKWAYIQEIVPASYGIKVKDIGPAAAGLEKKVSPDAIELAKRMGVWFDEVIDRFPANWTKQWHTMWSELQLKGVQLRGAYLKGKKPGPRHVRDYVAHIVTPFDKYTTEAFRGQLRGLSKGEYSTLLDKMVRYNISPNVLQRGLLSVTNLEQLRRSHELGRLHPKVYPAVMKWVTDLRTKFAGELGGIWAEHGGKFSEGVPKGFLQRTFDWLEKGPWQMEVGKKLEPRTLMHNTLTNLGNKLTDAASKGSEALAAEMRTAAEIFATPVQHTMLATEILPKYLRMMAPTYTWHVKGYGPQITKFANRTTGWQSTYVKDQIMPLLRGFKTWKGTLRAAAFGEQKHRIYSWFRDHSLFESPFPQSTRKWLMDYFANVGGRGGAESLSSDIAHWFYLSTLGFPNLSPTLKNMGQTWITTANVVGLRGMRAGLQRIIPRWGKFIDLRGKGIAAEVAFKRSFPEYVKHVGMTESFIDEIISGTMVGKVPKAAYTWAGKVKKGLMMPFQTSEIFLNRLLSFYSAYGSGLADGMTKKVAGEVGSVMVKATQFPGGPLNMPRMIMDWSPAFRQFMHFPMRYLGFLASSVRWGPDPTKLHFGTIGRTMMGSTAAYHGVKNLLGMDISQGLLWGALPGPTFEGSPFFPAPFVPPIVGIAGGLTAAATTGQARHLQSILPLLVPGGLGIRRLYRSFAPRYADYQNRTEDGRIPVYNRRRALVGTYSPLELFLRSIGASPATQTAERGAAQWLLRQREKMREYRREYIHALFQNDLKKAEEINRDFQKSYPELGPITLKKSDITALRNRREVTRLGRILRGFPKATRPLFETAASEAMMGNIMQDVETAPQNLGYYSNLFGRPTM